MPSHSPVKHQVRIIGGQWKRTPIAVVDAPGLRPTPDRVRETVFNWIGPRIVGARCLDLFAGTGALGLEAASRGAARVVSIEPHRTAAHALALIVQRLSASAVDLRQLDAERALNILSRASERFDVIFLDPPFGQEWLPKVLPAVRSLLATGGLIYVESERALIGTDIFPYDLCVFRQDTAGQVHYHLLTEAPSSAPPEPTP